MKDHMILDALDFTPDCECGHDMGDHAPDGCPYEPDCDCTGYVAGITDEPKEDSK